MKLVLISVAVLLCGLNASPTPQFFGGNPWSPLGNFIQQFQNSLPQLPIFPNFPAGNWNQIRPGAPVQIAPVAPNIAQSVPVQPVQQLVPVQANVDGIRAPDNQVANNGWYLSNWLPVSMVPQNYAQGQPTIIIIARPSKEQSQENASNKIPCEHNESTNSEPSNSSGTTATAENTQPITENPSTTTTQNATATTTKSRK